MMSHPYEVVPVVGIYSRRLDLPGDKIADDVVGSDGKFLLLSYATFYFRPRHGTVVITFAMESGILYTKYLFVELNTQRPS